MWLVRTLGSALAERLSRLDLPPLVGVLADAISAVCDAHRGTCDLSHPESPSATVVLVRERPGHLDHLVLCDSTVVLLDRAGEVNLVVTDDRTAGMRGLTRRDVAERRNQDGGFWVASTDPGAARHALTGSTPIAETAMVFACTDGVSRLVEHYAHTWRHVVGLAAGGSVRAVLDAVRQAESSAPLPGRKRHDDATAALCRPRPDGSPSPPGSPPS